MMANLNLKLVNTEDGLGITDGKQILIGDFKKLIRRIPRDKIGSEPLIKAARIKGYKPQQLTILDCTAGLGEDSFLLAAAGYKVIMYEANLMIASILEDALKRGSEDEKIKSIISNMKLFKGDSVIAMKNLNKTKEALSNDINNSYEIPGIIFLDPMFPKRQKKSLVKKKLQIIQKLESPCKNEKEMLKAAIDLQPKKIIIKRPIKGSYLGERKPTYSIYGSQIRYDCILI